MKKKKWLFIAIGIIVLLLGAIITYKFLNDDTKLTSSERTWINTNINNINNIYIAPDENLFSKDGHGVFYDFLNDVTEEYGINFNYVTTNSEDNLIKLSYEEDVNDTSKIFYTDHYILVGKEKSFIKQNSDLENTNIGILKTNEEYVKNYLKDININFTTYETNEELYNSLNDTTNFILVPRIRNIDQILANNLEIVYHLSDIECYYTLSGIDDTLSSILYKYFNSWNVSSSKYLKEEEFNLFTESLKITDSDIDRLRSVDYEYGFINNSPYEVIMSGKYGGIVAEYLREFSEFSGVYFNISKYRNLNKLIKQINKNKVDLYFDFNKNIEDNYVNTSNGILANISIITRTDNDKVFNSLYSLKGEEVYVEEGSNIYNYLMGIEGGIIINTYKDNKELYKLNKEDVIIILDTYNFKYLNNKKLNNYTSKYETYINSTYTFKVRSDYEILHLLLDKYINYLDTFSMINKGLNSHLEVVENGNILNTIIKYVILVIIAILFIGFIVYKNTKKIRIARKLKKDEKIRFIDELTCLKNRTYLSDFMKSWSNNTVYPQAIIVVDLNKLTEINEKYGVSEGDKQIQAFANALIKTQLDNSDLMRSDGNEFVIYTVGYTQKQIINYIHKLNKELKRLPYNYGAEFGYSIIESNLKTIEDALTEAIDDMKVKKGNK